jgi:galactokinase
MNYSKPIILSLQQKFAALFEINPLLFYSPGRINLIGEHLDYNNGFVLPAAIDKAIYTAISKRNDDLIVLYSMAFNEKIEAKLFKMY